MITTLPRPDRYRLYLDESGDHTYKRLDQAGQRYLALLGVWARQRDHYIALHDALENLKREVFGPMPDDPICLHRDDLINKRGPFFVLQNDEKRKLFDEGLLDLVSKANFHLVCVVLDKQQHLSRSSSPMHPYHYCLAAVLQRYCGWLNHAGSVGDVLAEARGRQEDRQLDAAYSTVYKSGMLYLEASKIQRALTSGSIKMKTKESNIAGLQIADLLAHPAKQWVLWQKGVIAEPKDYGRRLMEAVRLKFTNQGDTGSAEGDGWELL